MKRLAMTAERRQVFARQAAARFDRHEAALQPAIEAAIGDFVDLARVQVRREFARISTGPGVLRAHLTAAAPAGEPATSGGDEAVQWFTASHADQLVGAIDRVSPRFASMLDRHVVPVYSRMLDEILHTGLSDGRIAGDLQQWRGQWLEARTQSLVGVPDFVSGVYRTQIRGLAEREGTDVDDVEDVTQKLLDRGYPSWTGRARMIARTETVSSNNQGSLAAWSAMAHATGQTATKSWLATPDAATRPDHADADGQEVGINETFTVGTDQMTGPGDPNADPGNVINCRCAVTFDFSGSAESNADESTVSDLESQAGSFAASRWTWAIADPDDPPAAAASGNTGVAIMAVLADADAARFAVPGAAEPDAPGFHCTLAYLAEPASDYSTDERADLMRALAQITLPDKSITASVFGRAMLNEDDAEREPALVALVQSDDLAEAHSAVAAALAQVGMAASDTFPIWLAHATIGYNLPVDQFPAGLVGSEVTFDRIVVSWGDDMQVVGALDPSVDTPGS